MTRFNLLVTITLCCIFALASHLNAELPSAPSDDYRIVYIWLIVSPLPANKLSAAQEFGNLQRGMDFSLSTDAQACVKSFKSYWPKNNYEVLAVAIGERNAEGTITLSVPMRSNDHNKFSFSENAKVMLAPDGTLTIYHNGTVSTAKKKNDSTGIDWNSMRPGIMINHTYGTAALTSENGDTFLGAYCVIPGKGVEVKK